MQVEAILIERGAKKGNTLKEKVGLAVTGAIFIHTADITTLRETIERARCQTQVVE